MSLARCEDRNKAHVLSESKRKAMWRCAHVAWQAAFCEAELIPQGAVLAGVLAGVGAAFFAQEPRLKRSKLQDNCRESSRQDGL